MRAAAWFVLLLLLAPAVPARAQGAPPEAPLTLVAPDGRRSVATRVVNGRELIALDEVAGLFRVTVRDDALAGGVTVSYRGRTIVASPDRAMVSVDGRVAALPSPVVRDGRSWLVPLEFLSGPLASIYDQRIELRRASRLLLVGNIRLPRISARIESTGPPTRATIDISPAASVSATTEPGRVLLRIDAEGIDLAAPPPGGGLIEGIRLGNQPNELVVDLTATAGLARASISAAGDATRALVEVPAASSAAPRAPAAPAETPNPGPETRPPATEARAAAPEPRLPGTPSRAWRTIVIDAGHGGRDVGVRGPRGLEEKQLTLDVARRLKTLVETRLGLRVVLTRDDDRDVSVDERAAVANNGKADLLLSLHANGSSAPEQAGAEVFHLQLDRESEDVVRAATVEGTALPALGGGLRRLDLIPWDLAQARYLDESAILAGVLREELQRQLPMSVQPIRQAPMRLLTAANMPAALIEVAYLTNPDQEARLSTDEFKTAIAQALFSAIVRFRAWSEDARTP